MARARNIKPSFFQNEELADLPPLARLLFIGLWTVADYKGCLEFRAKRLKVQLLPYDECDIDALTKYLDKSGFVRIYSVTGQRYLKIVNFERHQNPHKNEREAGSEIPDMTPESLCENDVQSIEINLEQDGTAPADSLLLIPDSPFPQREPKKPRFDPAGIALPTCIPREVWMEWVAYRRERKLSCLERTMLAQVDNLVIWFSKGHYPPDVIKTSISNGWQGLFEPDVQGKMNYQDDRNATLQALTGGKHGQRTLERDITGEVERITG